MFLISLKRLVILKLPKVLFDLLIGNRLDTNILEIDTFCTLTNILSSKKAFTIRVLNELFSPDNKEITQKIIIIMKENIVLVSNEDLDAESSLYSEALL